jgi:hypothetical protein
VQWLACLNGVETGVFVSRFAACHARDKIVKEDHLNLPRILTKIEFDNEQAEFEKQQRKAQWTRF